MVRREHHGWTACYTLCLCITGFDNPKPLPVSVAAYPRYPNQLHAILPANLDSHRAVSLLAEEKEVGCLDPFVVIGELHSRYVGTT
jgi:hypothetical protein